jgi:hypothetical protein
MSETRPPMTAGPIERALRFLKRTSVNRGAPVVGTGLTDADSGGVVLRGDPAGDEPAPVGEEPGGDSSCAKQIDARIRPDITISRILISVEDKSWRFAVGGQARRTFAPRQTRLLSVTYDSSSP